MGHHFTGVHMTWGAINELSTLTGYQRLWTLAKHPVLDHILKHIAREEATHSFFYWSVARIKLMRSSFRQQLARFIINTFWSPVGENKKTPAESNVVIHTQDKDMRMVPGWHQTWEDFAITFVPEGTWAHRFHDKLYGRAWFWHQMLHGDDADYIPGLPEFADGTLYSKSHPLRGQLKFMKCGEKTAQGLLADCASEAEARAKVISLYSTFYGADTDAAILEQGILLWMRQRPGDVFDVCNEGNPLAGYDKARAIMFGRKKTKKRR